MPVVKPEVPRRGLLGDQCAWTPHCALKVPAPLAGREALGASGTWWIAIGSPFGAGDAGRVGDARLRTHEHGTADDPDRGETVAGDRATWPRFPSMRSR